MSDEVKVRFAGEASDRATLLLAAAEEMDLDAGVVRSTEGAFLVPEDVAKKAGVEYEGGSAEADSEEQAEKPKKRTAKKAAKKSAKKSTGN